MRWERWEQWQRGDPRWNVWTCDTTPYPIAEVVASLSQWATKQQQAYATGPGALQGCWWEE